MENYPEGEKNEMVEIYVKAGFTKEHAEQAINILSQNKGWFVDHMMVQELGIMPTDPDDNPMKNGMCP